jgi:hypothetical protein
MDKAHKHGDSECYTPSSESAGNGICQITHRINGYARNTISKSSFVSKITPEHENTEVLRGKMSQVTVLLSFRFIGVQCQILLTQQLYYSQHKLWLA